jgi:hypothetical protein
MEKLRNETKKLKEPIESNLEFICNTYTYSYKFSEEPNLENAIKTEYFISDISDPNVLYFDDYNVVVFVSQILSKGNSFMEATERVDRCVRLFQQLGQHNIEIISADIKSISSLYKRIVNTDFLGPEWNKKEVTVPSTSNGEKFKKETKYIMTFNGYLNSFVSLKNNEIRIINAVSISQRDYILRKVEESLNECFNREKKNYETVQRRIIDLIIALP